MPIVFDPEKVEKERSVITGCPTKPPYINRDYSSYSDVRELWRSDYAIGTIWECPDCNTYLVTKSCGSTTYTFWVRVKWYDFAARKEIKRLEDEKLPLEGKVL